MANVSPQTSVKSVELFRKTDIIYYISQPLAANKICKLQKRNTSNKCAGAKCTYGIKVPIIHRELNSPD